MITIEIPLVNIIVDLEQDPALRQADTPGTRIDKFTPPNVDLIPSPILNSDGLVKHPVLDRQQVHELHLE